jgi:polyhydroxyalkanoate synthesis regulator phasin
MEAGFKDRAYNSVAISRQAVDQVLDDWSERRAKLLAGRMKEMKEKTEELVKEMAKHPALHLGTKDDQLRLADEVGALLRTLVKLVDEPVEDQLAAWEQSYGGSLRRGVNELEDLNRQMRDTNRLYDDLSKGRIPR